MYCCCMKIHDSKRQKQFGACYALSARIELCSAIPHLSTMHRAMSLFQWKSAYKSGIVTCRAALHVLHKKDAKRSPFLADALNKHYEEWRAYNGSESLFHLLDLERNMLLKEGKSSFPMECSEEYHEEPHLLIGTHFLIGSKVVRRFMKWILNEIEIIEETAFWARRDERATTNKSGKRLKRYL